MHGHGEAIMIDSELEPGDRVPVTGRYEELDLLGRPTGKVFSAPRG